MKIKFLGHACFIIEFGGKQLLFDPFISPNDLAKEIEIEALQPDYILLSHGHGDHMADLEIIASQSNATLISNYELVSYFETKGIKGHPMNHGGKWNFDFGTVKLVNAVHSSTLPDGTIGGHPVGFVIWNDQECLYFAGDTALTYDMKIIPLTCPALSVALLPIGDNFTMGYEDAAIAAEWLNVNKVIGYHFDTFGYIKIDHQQAKNSFNEKGVELTIPEINEIVEI